MRVRIRKMKETDEGFVVGSWLAMFTNTSGLTRDQANDGVRRLIARVLSNPRSTVLVAVEEEDDSKIVGFSVTSGDVLHLVLVKREYRQRGAARALLADLPSPLRAYWPHKALVHLNRVIPVVLDPLALLDL